MNVLNFISYRSRQMIGRLLLDFLFPPTCPNCGAPVNEQGEWCPECFDSVLAIRQVPSELLQSLNEAWILAHYTGGVKTMIYDVKFNAKKEQSKGAVPFLHCFDFYMNEHELNLRPHLVVPIPTSKGKLKTRGYNQVDLLFKEWVYEKNKGVVNHELHNGKRVVKKMRDTIVRDNNIHAYWRWCDCLHKLDTGKDMWSLTGNERRKNVSDAFMMKAIYRNVAFWTNCDVLLIDDIYTTGATLEAAAHIIQSYHPHTIKALTLASGAY